MAFSQFPQKGGIPSGNTAGRPSNPVIGDTYYNGQLEILEIYNGTTWVANSAPPATPSITSVTDIGTVAYAAGGSLNVLFSQGSGGGTPSQYNAYTTSGGFFASSSSTTVTLSGLTPNTAFTVYGTAQNNFGTTVNTVNAAPVTVTTRPQAPTIGTASTSSVTTDITVTWTLGSNGGKNLTAIKVVPYLNGTTVQTEQTAATTSSTSATITGLTQGSAYTFKVYAINANGNGAESSATNSVTVPTFIDIDYLVVAGGGGGGVSYAGAGGAGGLRSTVSATGRGGTLETALKISKSTNYTVTVGAGGNGKSSGSCGLGTNGDNSVFSTVTSTGGGGGGHYLVAANAVGGNSGGCGGGGGTPDSPNSAGPGGAGTTGQGYDGGAGQVGANYRGGGGGGAGGVGSGCGGTGNAGNGGSGVVILRWLTSSGTISVGAGLTADATGTDGSYSYKQFTAGSGNVSWS